MRDAQEETVAGQEIAVVLLDVDGTLIDSNDAHAQSWVDVGAEFGYPIAFDDVRWLIGMGGDKVLPRMTGLEEDSKEGKKVLEHRGEIFRGRYLSLLAPFPHARELLERLRGDGFDLVVASSAGEEELNALLKQAGVADLMSARTSSDDAEDSKPDPDIVQAALRRARTKPERAVMLGDTPYDLGACQQAGVRLIAFRCGGWDDDALKGAVEIYDAPAELLERYETSCLGAAARRKKVG
jgi:phosphoglycolate phosphatase-like HAD superfamily hydrolase